MGVIRTKIKRCIKAGMRGVRHRWLSRESLIRQIRALPLGGSKVVLFHSSLSSLGFVRGGATTMLSLLDSETTVMAPAHTWQWVADAGLREFDARTTPSCVGQISQAFLAHADIVRSLHPTHSVAAIGPQASEMIAGHENASTPCGINTPYDRMIAAGGKIVFLGTNLSSNTCFHTLEAIANVPYLLSESFESFSIRDMSGLTSQVRIRCHRKGVRRRFGGEAVRRDLESRGAIAVSRVGDASCLTLDAATFFQSTMQHLAREPLYLLHDSERKRWKATAN
jgi:aminoglycoside 3-N-acetyltransferase